MTDELVFDAPQEGKTDGRGRPPAPPLTEKAMLGDYQGTGELGGIVSNTLLIAERMLAELDATTAILDEIESWIEEETKDDKTGAMRNAMLKAISLPSRALVLKTVLQAISETRKATVPEGKKAQRQQEAQNLVGDGNVFKTRTPPKLVPVK